MKHTLEQKPVQKQEKQPGSEKEMVPRPVYDDGKPGSGKLEGKVAIITGGDSGIGRAVAISFAKEGANVAIVYLDEHDDAKETKKIIRQYGGKTILLSTDLTQEENCRNVIEETIDQFGQIDILVNNAAVQFPQQSVEDIKEEDLVHTFQVNLFAPFYLVKYAIPHLKEGSCIINTASVTAYKGNASLIDYSATKGALVSFTRSLAQSLMKKAIRVNAVAPGPVWTPLIPASFSAEKVKEFGKDTMYHRPAQPVEISPCYVFLASADSNFITGQVLHPNGGFIVNG
ncbi:MAG: SDR family oxidoreductase [Chitinophagaceae bacterium]